MDIPTFDELKSKVTDFMENTRMPITVESVMDVLRYVGALRTRDAQQRDEAAGGKSPLPENSASEKSHADKMGGSLPYLMGYDCEIHGANTTNCHFSLFDSPEHTAAWEAGVAQAKKDKVAA